MHHGTEQGLHRQLHWLLPRVSCWSVQVQFNVHLCMRREIIFFKKQSVPSLMTWCMCKWLELTVVCADTPNVFESLPNWRPVYNRNETVIYQSAGGYVGYKILPGTFDRPNAAVIITDPFSMATKVPLIPSALQLSTVAGLLLESTPVKALEIQLKVPMQPPVRINEMCDRSTVTPQQYSMTRFPSSGSPFQPSTFPALIKSTL